MNRRAKLFAVISLLMALVLAPAVSAFAQGYPPPPRTPRPSRPPQSPGPPERTPRATARPTPRGGPASCFGVSGEVGDDFRPNVVEFRGDVEFVGGEGCAEGTVEFTVHSHPVVLGTTEANEDGSYRARFTLPAHITPGMHTAFAEIEGREDHREPLRVLGAADSGAGPAGPGGSTGNRGDGTLPRTGGDLALLFLWAIILIGLGTILVLTTARWWQRAGFVRALTVRFANGHTSSGVRALPPGHIPFVDTSRFVPGHTRTNRNDPPPGITEWDIAQQSDRPN